MTTPLMLVTHRQEEGLTGYLNCLVCVLVAEELPFGKKPFPRSSPSLEARVSGPSLSAVEEPARAAADSQRHPTWAFSELLQHHL